MATAPGDPSTGRVRRASCRSTLGLGRAAPRLQARDDLAHVEIGGREDGVGRPVVEADAAVAEVEMTAREDRVVEEAVALVVLFRLEDRTRRPREHAGGVVPVEEQRAHRVVRVVIDAVIELEPAFGDTEWHGRRARPALVPPAAPRQAERSMPAPLLQIIARRDPDPEDLAERLR